MRDEILLECIDCKNNYIGTTHTDGYRCPECGSGHLIGVGNMKLLEKYKENQSRIKLARQNGNVKDAAKRARHKRVNHAITCLAMAIINHTNEINNVDVDIRQRNNDMCFDFAEKKIKDYLIGINWASGKDITVYSPVNNPVIGGYVDEYTPL